MCSVVVLQYLFILGRHTHVTRCSEVRDDLWESGLPSALWVPGIELNSAALVEEPFLTEPLCQSTRLPFKFRDDSRFWLLLFCY